MKSLPRLVMLLALPAVLCCAQSPRTFTNQYTFGDSLSDNGNAHLASGRTLNAQPPYFGGRWSNGPTFVELLGNNLAIGSAAPAAVRSSMGFAFGGATVVPAVSAVPFPPLPLQLQLFQSHGVTIQRTDLFTVWIGANDIINTAPSAPLNPAVMDVAGFNAAAGAASGLQALIGMGAKNILVLNMPDIGATPVGVASGAGAFLTRGSLAYNREFDARLAALAAAAPYVTITRIDAAALITQVQRDFRELGFSNVTSGLTFPTAQGGGGDPAGYVFFDGLHPTARTHALLANVALEALNPEPVIGFGATLGSAALALDGLATSAVDARVAQLAISNRAARRAEAYATFNYGEGNRARDGWRPKFDYQAQVVTAGVDVRLSDGVFVGGALNAGRANVEVTANGGDFTMEDGAARLYAVWRGGPVSFIADGTYGVLHAKGIHRATALGGLRTTGKAGGDHWGVGLKAAWAVDLNALTVRPWLGLRTSRVSVDGYTERDVTTLAMQFDGQEAKSTGGAVGVDAACNWKLAGRAARWDFRAAWHGEIGSKERTVAGRLANNFTRPTVVTFEDGDGDGLELGGALTVFCAKNCSASLGYAADIRNHEKLAHRATLSLQTGF